MNLVSKRLFSSSARPVAADAVTFGALPSLAVRIDLWLLAILAFGALTRVVFFVLFQGLPLQMDEVQYQEIAVNLTDGRGFALGERLTSWRPPLYPFLMSMLYRVTGTTDPVSVRAVQAVLSLGIVLLVYLIARTVFGTRTGRVAAAVAAFYPSLLFYNNHVLTEVLFIFLCLLTAYALVAYLARPRALVILGAGLALGLAVLTREILWPTVVLMSALMAFGTRLPWRRWAWHSALLVAGLLVVTVPWVVRNTLVQGTFTLIATNGGMVFLAGNYENTPWDHPWQANALPPELKVRRLFPETLSEGVTQKLATRRAIAFIREHPWRTARMNVIRVANLWGLERELTGVFAKGTYGAMGAVRLVATTAIINAAYLFVVLMGLLVLCFALQARGPWLAWHLYTAVLIVFTTLVHMPVSAHPRYHLPLVPLLAMYAVQAWPMRRTLWAGRRTFAFRIAAACTGLLALAWIRDIAVDLERFLRAAKLL